MELNLRFRKFITICLFFTLVGIICFGYLSSEIVCNFSNSHLRVARIVYQPESNSVGKIAEPEFKFNRTPGLSFDNILNEKIPFDMNGHDVMVFLHIQKTGGTSFGRHLVQDLDLQRPCTCQRKQKRCYCFRPNRNENWLFSRYSTGWKCGLHADWTELTNCVDFELDKNENKGEVVKRRYFYISLLREPVSRFLSEFKHVQRGATWKNSRHWCGGRIASAKELPKCYSGQTWKNVSLNEFLSCPHNLAANRQARMISDLSLVGCYNKSFMATEERDRIILESAKHNLASMAFFYLTEYQKVGQYLFEEIFNLRFAVPFAQYNSTRSSDYGSKLKPEQLAEIRRVNKLDIELYEFAKSLMFTRFKFLSERDPDFEKRWKHLGELSVETEFNWDVEIELEPSLVRATNTK